MSRSRKADNSKNSKSYYIYGKHACVAALANKNREIHKILLQEGSNLKVKGDVKFVSRQDLDKVTNFGVHQGIAVLTSYLSNYSVEDMESQNRVLILDQLTDPQNIGAIIRSALGFGFNAVIAAKDQAPDETGSMAKAAVGALEKVKYIKVTNINQTIKQLKKEGFWVVALDGSGKQEISTIQDFEKLALVIGAEGKGVRDNILKNSDISAKINMDNQLESLNASVAASIAMYCLMEK